MTSRNTLTSETLDSSRALIGHEALMKVRSWMVGVTVAAFIALSPLAHAKITETTTSITGTTVELSDMSLQLDKEASNRHTLFTQSGDTLRSLFSKLKIKDKDAEKFIRASRHTVGLTKPKNGWFVSAETSDKGQLQRIRLYQEAKDARQNRLIEVTRKGKNFESSVKPFRFDERRIMTSGQVKGTLAKSMEAQNIPADIHDQVKNAFLGDHVLEGVKAGDAYRLIYTAQYVENTLIRVGDLKAIQLDTKGKTQERFLFNGAFYDPQGRNNQPAFRRVPLDHVEISSPFNNLRRHPITGKVRPHYGTDFRAPRGTPVYAPANGVVKKAGWGSGYGRVIIIDHGSNYETTYAHLASINIKNGARVKRGQLIGRVGSSGLSSGPHLHYELKRNGVNINPMTAKLPTSNRLSTQQLAQLKNTIQPLRQQLASAKSSQVAMNVKAAK